MLIDTHSHIYEPEFDADREQAIERCHEAGVELIMLPAIDSESYERMFALARRLCTADDGFASHFGK